MHFIFSLLFIPFVYSLDNKITKASWAADDAEFPYMALIRKFKSQMAGDKNWCGGVIVSSTNVMTTAQCVADEGEFKNKKLKEADLSKFTIIAGTIWANGSGPGVQKRKIKRVIFPKDSFFISGLLRQNVALLFLASNFVLQGQHVAVATFRNFAKYPEVEPYYKSIYSVAGQCHVLGWGHMNATKDENYRQLSFAPAKQLLVANYTPISMEECKTHFCKKKTPKCNDFPYTWDGIFCGLPIEKWVDVCVHDEGSPLICNNEVAGLFAYVDPDWGCGFGGPAGFVSGKVLYDFREYAYKIKSNADTCFAFGYVIAFLVGMSYLS